MKLWIHFCVIAYQSNNYFQFSFYNLIFWILICHCRVSKNQKIYKLSHKFQFLTQTVFLFNSLVNFMPNFVCAVLHTWAISCYPILVDLFTMFHRFDLDNILFDHIFLWFSSTSGQKSIVLTFRFHIFHNLSLPFPKLSISMDICKHYCISI